MKTNMMDLRLVAIIALVALGIAALLIAGEMGKMLMVAVTAALGVMAVYLFTKASKNGG